MIEDEFSPSQSSSTDACAKAAAPAPDKEKNETAENSVCSADSGFIAEETENPVSDAEKSEMPQSPAAGSSYPKYENPHGKTSAFTVKENVTSGVIGALLFSLAGGGIAFLLTRIRYIASLSGIISIALAVFGYDLFSGLHKVKKHSMKGIITGIIMTVLILFITDYCSMALSAFNELNATPGIAGFDITYSYCFVHLFGILSKSGLKAFWVDLLFQYAFAAIGCWVFISQLKKAEKQTKNC